MTLNCKVRWVVRKPFESFMAITGYIQETHHAHMLKINKLETALCSSNSIEVFNGRRSLGNRHIYLESMSTIIEWLSDVKRKIRMALQPPDNSPTTETIHHQTTTLQPNKISIWQKQKHPAHIGIFSLCPSLTHTLIHTKQRWIERERERERNNYWQCYATYALSKSK